MSVSFPRNAAALLYLATHMRRTYVLRCGTLPDWDQIEEAKLKKAFVNKCRARAGFKEQATAIAYSMWTAFSFSFCFNIHGPEAVKNCTYMTCQVDSEAVINSSPVLFTWYHVSI